MAFIPDGCVVKLSSDMRLVVGEVSRKPQVRETKKGGNLVKFSMCAGAKPGTDQEEKLYINCIAYSNGIVNYCSDLDRGDPICAIGKMQSREYEGKTYYDLKLIWINSPVITPDITPYAVPKSSGGGDGSYGGYTGQPEFNEEDDDEDLPF